MSSSIVGASLFLTDDSERRFSSRGATMPDTISEQHSRHFVALAERRPIVEGGVATRFARLQNTMIA